MAYHAPCHLRAQGVGFKGRDLLRKIPGVRIAGTVMECCGHDGTYAMTVEGFEPSQRIGKKAFDGMKGAEAADLGHRLPAGGAPVPAARRQEAAPPGLGAGPRLPRGRVRAGDGEPSPEESP